MTNDTTTDEPDESTDDRHNDLADFADRLADRATTIETTDPTADLADLEPTGDALAGARVIGLGEATHGTREFFRLKHRLLRYLVVEQGVRLFGMEANFAEALAINEYVVSGEGDPRAAIDGIYFWTWDTEEVLALIEWIRGFNEDRTDGDRVRFYGYDAQYTAGPVAALEAYLRRADSELHAAVADDLAMVNDEGDTADDAETRRARLDAGDRVMDVLSERLHDRKAAHVSATDERAWRLACQHLRTLDQACEVKRAHHDDDLKRLSTVRDRAMADNVEWVLDHESAERIVLWAHNAHVHRGPIDIDDDASPPSMGGHLAERYGDRYYALGFDFARGEFQALAEIDDGRELTACSLDAPPAGSLSELFAATEKSLVFADMATVTADEQLSDWLDDPRRMRSVGAIYYGEGETDRHNDRRIVPETYDGVLFVAETNRAVPIERE